MPATVFLAVSYMNCLGVRSTIKTPPGKKPVALERLHQDIEFLRDPQYGYVRAGYPKFMYLFGRDSCIISWQLMDYDSQIARNTINILASLQGKNTHDLREEEPGKIIHWAKLDTWYTFLPWEKPCYYSVDSTPLFVYLCWLYFQKMHDQEWLEDHWPNIEQAVTWCEIHGGANHDYFIEYQKKNIFSLAHQGWKDNGFNHLHIAPPVKIVEVQGYYYAALKSASVMARALGQEKESTYYENRAALVKQSFLEKFWLPEKQAFAFAIDGQGRTDMRVTSNIGHLLFTGILDDQPAKVAAIVKQLFGPEMWTPYGIRTHSMKNPDFDAKSYHLGSVWPHDNWIIAQGLKRLGYLAEYEQIKTALNAAYKALGGIYELYEVEGSSIKKWPGACQPQGWASGALLNLWLDNPNQ